MGLIKLAPENIHLKTCPACFSPSTECIMSSLHPKLLSGLLKVSSCHNTWFNPYEGRWQAPIASANLYLRIVSGI